MIQVRNISKTYPSGPLRLAPGSRRHRALHAVSFDAPTGQILGLLGPNGAGKSTTIRIATGFLTQDAGTVNVNGHDTLDAPTHARASIGYLPESNPLYPELTPTAYLRHRAALFGLRGRARTEAVDRAIERCWLTPMKSKRIGALSKGYKQRVGLAAALLHDPPVLVLDEPSNGLDPTQIRETRGLVRELATDRTMLLSSHILAEVERTCDRVVMIAAGKVRADGTLAELAKKHAAGDAALILEARSTDDTWIRKIHGVLDLSHAALDADWTRFEVKPDAGAPDLREAIASAASQAGVPLRELTRREPGLEQLFLSVMESADQQEDPA